MKLRFALFLILWAFALVSGDEENSSYSKNAKLRNDLLKNYDKHALPQKNKNGTTTVYVLMRPRSFRVNDIKETITVDSWMAFFWVDKRLKWNPNDYGKLRRVHFGDDELWKPDITLYNNADMMEVDHYGDTHFLVYSRGYVIWVPPARMVSICAIDLTFWPIDQHTCDIEMGSWTTTGLQIDLQLWHNITEMNMWAFQNISSGWSIKEAKQRRDVLSFSLDTDETFVDIHFIFNFQRNAPTFLVCVVVPAVMLPLLLMLQFILPVNHSKRFIIGCCCVLLTILEIIFLKFTIPRIGTSVPLIVKYYTELLIICVLTMAMTAFLGRLSHPLMPLLDYPPPEPLKRFLKGPISIVICLRTHATKVGLSNELTAEGNETAFASDTKNPSYHHEWLLVAKATDRLAVILLIVVFVFSLCSFVSPLS